MLPPSPPIQLHQFRKWKIRSWTSVQRPITVAFTPKFHSKIAGEGIKCSWELSKKYYCWLPYRQKRSFRKFVSCAKFCLSQLVLSMNRQFSQNVHTYMFGYYHQAKESEYKVRSLVKQESSFAYNEKIQAMYQATLRRTTDCPFILQVIKECII